MARTLTIYSYVLVVGYIWQGIRCAMEYSIKPADAKAIKTRDDMRAWLRANAGDFDHVEDFQANLAHGATDLLLPWEDEDSEFFYWDCVTA